MQNNNQDFKSDLITYRLNRAKETVTEAKVLVSNHMWRGAADRLYHACFYGILALMVLDDIKSPSHKGMKSMFLNKYVRTGKVPENLGQFFSEIYQIISAGEYIDFQEYKQEDIDYLLTKSEEFVNYIDKILQ